ncbi:MAG: AAA family ATPase, partial [Chitinivibrionia bacterium]|nr:AAA family ATPase [Chitinivibrionia bacterium]MCL1947554.1 AAA family ATPase [Chitinivibrionia bacterium]
MFKDVNRMIFAEKIQKSLKNAPVSAILGPRQCGKTTFVKMLAKNNDDFILLDLERPSDKNLLQDAERF